MSYAGDISPTHAWEMLSADPEVVLVDCRTAAEWNYVGIPELSSINKKAVLVQWVTYPNGEPNINFVEQLREAGISDESPVVFLCRSGQRSIGAAVAATAAGIKDSYNILDGFEGSVSAEGHRDTAGWKALGLPWVQF